MKEKMEPKKEKKSGSDCVGKTNSDMLKLGRNRAKIAAQKRG